MSVRVGIDIGGTFTDIVCLEAGGRIRVKKVSSSPDDYARAIIEGVRELSRETGLAGADVTEVLHGTTVASNAILEGRGAKTGLITTRGFRDVLEIRRLRMPRLYDLAWEKPAPLVERFLRAEVTERVSASGDIRVPLDPAEAERVLDGLAGGGRRGARRLPAQRLREPRPRAGARDADRPSRPAPPAVGEPARSCPRSRSTSGPRRRSSTPTSRRSSAATWRRWSRGSREIDVTAPLLVMQSNGGLTSAEAAGRFPMHIVESGPAAGVVGAQALARQLGLARLITFDMGGTTAKASIVEDGEVYRAGEIQVGGGITVGSRLLTGAGYLLRVPAIDLAEVGAGGGSVVWIDAGGALRVGPHSAGAAPGPVCYDLGGDAPTITDASLILGYLNPTQLAGGSVKLNAARAHEVFEARVARPLGLPLAHAAHGAHLIAASNMIRAIRAVSTERGRDPARVRALRLRRQRPALRGRHGAGPRDADASWCRRPPASSRRSACSTPIPSATTSAPPAGRPAASTPPASRRRGGAWRRRRAPTSRATGSRARPCACGGSPTRATWARAPS